jgi:type II secretory pathway component PulF
MSSAFLALIWWVVPALGLSGALLYVFWVTKFEGKFQQETQRSVGQFQRFQDSLRDSQARDFAAESQIAPTAAAGNNQTQLIKPDPASDFHDDNPFLKKS